MDHRSKHENIAKIISQTTLENFLESLSAVEYNMCHLVQEAPKCLVPLEANFQLPNVFLKTKLNFKSEKLLTGDAIKANWNSEVSKISDFLEEIELEEYEMKVEKECNEKGIEELIRWRYGMN